MKFKKISIDEIRPNPFQPRETFDKTSLKELADSIKDVMIIQPIIVRHHGFNYQIIAGERRWRAAQLVGLKEIPCIVKEVEEERVLFESLIENLHRKDLSNIELENAIAELWERRDLLGFTTKTELAKKIGVTPDFVSRYIDAWETRQNMHVDQRVSTDAIRATRGLDNNERKIILEKVAKGDLGVREAYTTVKVLKRASKPLKNELLKAKTLFSPKAAEKLLETTPFEEDQKKIIEEITTASLTKDEVEKRVQLLVKPTGLDVFPIHNLHRSDHSNIIHEYVCPQCKKRYTIKCDGTNDWLERSSDK